MPSAHTDQELERLNDPKLYAPGFEPTALMLERQARAVFGLDPAPLLPRRVHQQRPDVQRALRWVADVADVLVDEHLALSCYAYDEALRLAGHARAMQWGARLAGGVSQCPYCHEVESIWSDGARAVCITPTCRRGDGSRRCWQLLDTRTEQQHALGGPPRLDWQEVDEPSRLTDDELDRAR